MFKEFNLPVSEEKFAAFLDGNLSENEMNQIQNIIRQNQDMQEISNHCIDIDETYQHMVDIGLEAPYDEHELLIPILDNDVLKRAEDNKKITMPCDRKVQKIASIKTNNKNINDMSNESKFNLAPGTAAVSAYAAHKLYTMYKSGQLDFFSHRNVAGNVAENIESNENGIGFAQAETAHGMPELDIKFDPSTYQYYPDTCAFQSQALILKEYGFDVTQEDLVQIAKEQGWYVDGYGTPVDKVGKMLEHFGVDTSITEGNNIFNLTNELAQGHRVLVTVDSGELWSPGMGEKLEDLILGQRQDHALLVVGVDTSNPDDIKVIVTDPGNGNTQFAYSEEQFLNAWKDSNCFMAATNESPTEFVSHQLYPPMDTFANIPYSTICRLSDSTLDVVDSNYHDFFDALMDNPTEIDSLINDYYIIFI